MILTFDTAKVIYMNPNMAYFLAEFSTFRGIVNPEVECVILWKFPFFFLNKPNFAYDF